VDARPSTMEGVAVTSLAEFYRGKRVLLTGHTGFKGSWLALWLTKMGALVTGFALPPEHGERSLFHAAGVESMIKSHIGDIRDRAATLAVLRESDPEIVIHNAAQALVWRSYADPFGTYETNVLGTVNVLEAVRQSRSVRSAVVVTTDKCYENREWYWAYREIDRLGGHDPYSSSKACAELVTASYRSSFFGKGDQPAISTVRAGNAIGGGDWAENRLVPDIARAIASGLPVAIRNPHSTRPWQHVLEPLRGYLMLARAQWERKSLAGAWNFGPSGDGVTVQELAARMILHWGCGTMAILQEGASSAHEAHTLRVDNSKAGMELGWRPMLSFDESIQMTAAWYRTFLADPRKGADLTLNQIETYMNRFTTSVSACGRPD
jgi:CDP-glucose 4,6-dehydratase